MWINPDGSVHVEWDRLMNLGLPDDAGHGEYTQALGQRIWFILHGIGEHYGCHGCQPDAVLFFSGIHDLKNIELEKPVYDLALWEDFVSRVKKADAARRKVEFSPMIHA
jgi:hypothetical protein